MNVEKITMKDVLEDAFKPIREAQKIFEKANIDLSILEQKANDNEVSAKEALTEFVRIMNGIDLAVNKL